jgi:hypothetical protein
MPSKARHDDTHETTPQALIDHTYRDFSTIEPVFDGPDQSIHGHSKKNGWGFKVRLLLLQLYHVIT